MAPYSNAIAYAAKEKGLPHRQATIREDRPVSDLSVSYRKPASAGGHPVVSRLGRVRLEEVHQVRMKLPGMLEVG